jgi:hypothetical protein
MILAPSGARGFFKGAVLAPLESFSISTATPAVKTPAASQKQHLIPSARLSRKVNNPAGMLPAGRPRTFLELKWPQNSKPLIAPSSERMERYEV